MFKCHVTSVPGDLSSRIYYRMTCHTASVSRSVSPCTASSPSSSPWWCDHNSVSGISSPPGIDPASKGYWRQCLPDHHRPRCHEEPHDGLTSDNGHQSTRGHTGTCSLPDTRPHWDTAPRTGGGGNINLLSTFTFSLQPFYLIKTFIDVASRPC